MKTVEEYLASGRTITVLPPGTAFYGYSPHQPIALAPSDLYGIDYAAQVKRSFDLAKCAEREKGFKSPTPKNKIKKAQAKGLSKGRASTRAKFAIRRARLVEDHKRGMTIEQIAAREKISIKRIREIFRAEAYYPS